MNNIEMMNSVLDPDKVPAWHNDFWTITQEELDRYTNAILSRERNGLVRIIEANILDEREACWGIVSVYSSNDCRSAAKAIRARGEA